MVAIPTSMQTLDIKRATVVDKNGNPIVVSGVVTFQVVDSVRAAFGTPTQEVPPAVQQHAPGRNAALFPDLVRTITDRRHKLRQLH